MKRLRDLLLPPEPSFPPSDSPADLAADLLETEKMAEELVDYLLGNRLFRQIVVETPMGVRRPKMTLGGLWERIQHLEAAEALGPADRKRLEAVKETWSEAMRRYPDQARAKLRSELKSYLHNWQYFLRQARNNPERWREEYDVEIRNKRRIQTVVHLLGKHAPEGLLEDLEKLEAEVEHRAARS
ncbi:MAG: hypothetical protein D6775_03125 [Caldilineae bacterium]|nr:MAG: hypothetical protein D6775_03125 [Caldilineae bacterium]